MRPIEIARRLAELGQIQEAQKGYVLALNEKEIAPEEELEAAAFLLTSQAEDYQTPYRTFVSLFNRGFFQGDILDILSQAFYFPNAADLRGRYEANCRRLMKYPYFFRRDFVAFEDLPVLFFPFDDQGFLPYYPAENRFGAYVDFNTPVIDRYFFKDLEDPILAKDVFSQYQLEYLNDTVRKSEWVGRENHIYLHYSDWAVFCAYLQCLEFKKLLKDEKFVFLIEDEVSRYPIDFKAEYGIDYSKYPVKPFGIREINRLIWHSQLSTHNGGDFFNEVLAEHPNLLTYDSIMFDDMTEAIRQLREDWEKLKDQVGESSEVRRQLLEIGNPTDKDFLVATYLEDSDYLCKDSRIVPALLFQPHFENIHFTMVPSDKVRGYMLVSEEYEALRNSPFMNAFKYVKTFTPIRRITTSYAASVRFGAVMARKSWAQEEIHGPDDLRVVNDVLANRLTNRSYMVDPQDRFYKDSVIVRFEDGKLNPTATFTALAEFLDIPYTESMKTCTELTPGLRVGFKTGTVFVTYEDYANDTERELLEYLMGETYEAYGYDHHYYTGEKLDTTLAEKKALGAVKMDGLILSTYEKSLRLLTDKGLLGEERLSNEKIREIVQEHLKKLQDRRISIVQALMECSHFVSRDGEPLRMMALLKLDPDLLERPIYR